MADDIVSPMAAVTSSVGEILSHLIPHSHQATVRSFEEDARQYGPLNRRPLGLRAVPLNRIVGSVGRARELGPNFQPHSRRWQAKRSGRYQRVYEGFRRGDVLPPVELYKLGYNYYVLDGNHRVAAMKHLTSNDGDIDAYVTQFLPAGDTEAARVYLERRAFEEATGLTQVGAVERGHYPALQREIEAYRAEVSAVSGRDLPLKEAAGDWYAVIWLPRADEIRRADLRRFWPEKRTADIYCYIREHQVAETARLGRSVGWAEALRDFRARHGSRRQRELPNLRRLLHLSAPFRPGRLESPPLPRPSDELDLEAQPLPPPDRF